MGGDLYGVCAAGPDRLVIFLGDVSGKGIPASMFMVRAISLARLLAREIVEPERILARLNDELAEDNPSGMFVTFLCAVFRPETGRLTMANGGHCRPLLLTGDAPPRWAVKKLGTALGLEPGLEFERTELTLRAGDALLLYTDGVSEAFNGQEECYGNERLLADAGNLAGEAASGITTGLANRVRAFAAGAPQSDDIAILALKVAGSTPAAPAPGGGGADVTLELQGTPDEVMRAVDSLREFAGAQGASEKVLFDLSLALEECGSNVVNHALCRDPGRRFWVAFRRSGDSIVIELRDDGPAFDPTRAVARPPIASDEDLPGGWGIQLVRGRMDTIDYARRGGENILRLTKRLVPVAGEK